MAEGQDPQMAPQFLGNPEFCYLGGAATVG